MTQVAALNTSPSAGMAVLQSTGSAPERVAQPVRTDAEVVAVAASAQPIAQASRFMTFTLIPETSAASWLSAVARIKRPTEV